MQAEPAAGPETAEHVPQEFVVQTETPRESQTQMLQSCGKVEPGMHAVEEEGVVVVVVVGAVVVVVVVELEDSVGQVEGQNPYSPSI
jgi:dTDP-4-dehydrorhamnose 3,5-epimerase-like enzyme